MDNIFGEPTICTRIGNEYQTQIPDVIMKEAIENEENKYIGYVVKDVQLPAVPILDEDAFLLGLYIFGKNFKLVNKFMGNKGMPDVLFYYYGQFYGNDKHKIWSSSWMNKNKLMMPGMKIFTGWRLEELLDRVFPNVTDDNKCQLTKAIRDFDNKEIPFETYVFSIVDVVGINILVKAIAIGEGKKDLTRKSKRQLKKAKLHPPFSSLTTDNIINLLKYGIELSKENLVDLFWEAVWPRLLLRGWSSRQLRDFNFNNSENSFVFLAPGVSKFSPRGQINGIHYFLSFVDILNKVASEPQLIEPDQDQDMLKPEEEQCSNREDVVQFFVVDSSLENQIFKMKKISVSELSDEQDSSFEIQSLIAIQSRLEDKDRVKYRIFTEASGSNYPLKRKRGVEERTDSHILVESAFAERNEQDYVT